MSPPVPARETSPARAQERQEVWLAAFFLLVLVGFRIWATDYARFGGDESDYWATTLRLARFREFPVYGPAITGSSAHLPGPLYFYLLAGPLALFESPRAGGIAVALLHGLTALCAYGAARQARGPRAGLLLLALLMFAPWDVLYADRMWGGCIIPVFGTLTFYAAIKCHEDSRWSAALIVLALVLPQLHLSTPIVWFGCGALLLLRPPKWPSKRVAALALFVVLLAYSPAIVEELRSGFENSRAISKRMGSGFVWDIKRPLQVLGYSLLYTTSEMSYQFARGYWGGFDDQARYFSFAGFESWVSRDGLPLFFGSWISILLSALGWGAVVRRIRPGLRKTENTSRSLEASFTVAVLVAIAAAIFLLLKADRTFYPHYCNIIVPMVFVPVACGLDRCVAGRSKALVLIGTPVVAVTMAVNTVRYYSTVDGLIGVGATVSLVEHILAEEEAVALRFEGFNNGPALERISRELYGVPLPLDHRSKIRHFAKNAEPQITGLQEDGFGYGPLFVERKILPRGRPPTKILFRSYQEARSARVVRETADGRSIECRWVSPRPWCQYGNDTWMAFAAGLHTIGGVQHHVLEMHPVQGSKTRASWQVPQGATQGRLRYGLTDAAVAYRNKSPVHVQVFVDDRLAVNVRASSHRGLRERRFTVSGARKITVEVTCDDDAHRRFVFDLQLHQARDPHPQVGL